MLTQAKHFQELECSAYHDKYATATATAVGFEDENADWVDLDAILTTLANVADSACKSMLSACVYDSNSSSCISTLACPS